MTKPVWKSGPPPSLGWWPANTIQDRGIYSWWDGKRWSIGFSKVFPPHWKDRLMLRGEGAHVEWSARPKSWPARSRT